jgi:hypothetical protein
MGPAISGIACAKEKGRRRKAISNFGLMNDMFWLENLFGVWRLFNHL